MICDTYLRVLKQTSHVLFFGAGYCRLWYAWRHHCLKEWGNTIWKITTNAGKTGWSTIFFTGRVVFSLKARVKN